MYVCAYVHGVCVYLCMYVCVVVCASVHVQVCTCVSVYVCTGRGRRLYPKVLKSLSMSRDTDVINRQVLRIGTSSHRFWDSSALPHTMAFTICHACLKLNHATALSNQLACNAS